MTVPLVVPEPTASYMTVTPETAREWLKRNGGNRAMRRSTIDQYAKRMMSGQWVITDQGVSFDVHGNLINGQHRLEAIVKSGVAAVLLVVRGLPSEARRGIDQGLRRTTADRLRVDKRIAEVCSLAGRIYGHEDSPSDHLLEEMLGVFAAPMAAALDHCNVQANYFGTAPMRLAMSLALLDGNRPEYVLTLYSSLCRHDTEKLPPIGHALLRQVTRDRLKANDKNSTLARGLYVFDERHAHFRQVRVDVASVGDTVRRVINKVRDTLPGIA